jgi:hypothetical protein
MSKSINDYYQLAELVNYDITTVALLIQLQHIQPLAKIVNDLEDLKAHKYEAEIDRILSMKTGTIKDLRDLYYPTSLDYGIKKVSKTVTSETNLLSFMEG